MEAKNAENEIKMSVEEFLITESGEPFRLLSDEQQDVLSTVAEGQHLFLSGKAGVGKSFTLLALTSFLEAQGTPYLVCAPTGRAALNVQGQTVHKILARPNVGILSQKGLTIIIDEVSMLRADTMDDLDEMLREIRNDLLTPFGGCKMVMIGDVLQLPPVVGNDPVEKKMMKERFRTEFFFSSKSFSQIIKETKVIKLTKVFRQSDEEFVNILNRVRVGQQRQALAYLSNRKVTKAKGAIVSGRKADVEAINQQELDRLLKEERAHLYAASVNGDFPIKDLPAPEVLTLVKGARVIVVKNIYQKSKADGSSEVVAVNGEMGEVVECKEYAVDVLLDRGDVIRLGYQEWENKKTAELTREELLPMPCTLDELSNDNPEQMRRYYEVANINRERQANNALIEKGKKWGKKTVGTATQIPLMLAWAVTIHKTQGMSLDEVTVDVRKPMFAPGQLYVALSRCRNADKLWILGTVRPSDISADERALEFLKNLSNSKYIYAEETQEPYVQELFESYEGDF